MANPSNYQDFTDPCPLRGPCAILGFVKELSHGVVIRAVKPMYYADPLFIDRETRG
jgi:hypothetical protein